MNWISGIAVYLIVWWVVLFAVLPWGVEPVDEGDVARGHAHGAPKRPRLLLKMGVTTLVAAVAWVIIDLIILYGGISLRDPGAGP